MHESHKKICLAICGVLVLILLIGALLYFVPQSTRVSQTLNATKLDKDGNIIGMNEIALQGSFKDYWFRESTLELYVAPFGTLKSIKIGDDNRGNTTTVPIAFDEFYTLTYMAWDTSKGDSVFGTITMSQDFEYWVFYVHDDAQPIYYVASASGEHTSEEIVQYFKGLAPGYVSPNKTTEINWKMNGTFVYADGTAEEADISIIGDIYTAQNEEIKLNIDVTTCEEFSYLFSKPESHYSSFNQKNNDLPYLIICPTYTYNKQTNESTMTFFALDVEKEYFIALFEDMPNCYYVAAAKEDVTHEQLVTYFSDFVESYSAHVWKK